MRNPISLLVLLLASAAFGCGKSHSAAVNCGEGGEYSEDGVVRYCAYVVVKGGFECPEAVPFRLDIGEGAVCSSVEVTIPELPESVCKNFDDICGMITPIDGGSDADADGGEELFVCSAPPVTADAVVDPVNPLDETSICDATLFGPTLNVHLNGVSITSAPNESMFLVFNFYACPEQDDTCHCTLTMHFQNEFQAIAEGSPLLDMTNTDVSMTFMQDADNTFVQIDSAITVRQTLLFAYRRTTATEVPTGSVSVFNNAALSATVRPDETLGTCPAEDSENTTLRTKVSYLAPVEPPTEVRSIDIDQTGVIDGDGGDTFRIWVREASRIPDGDGGAGNYVHAWAALPE